MIRAFHFGILLSAAVLFFLVKTDLAIEREELQRELAPFLMRPVTYEGTTYEIRQGNITPALGDFDAVRVLRTARFSLQTRLDPILALEGTDPDLLDESVAALRLSAEHLSSFYPESLSIADNLHPLAFLMKLGDLERLRKEVITTPNPAAIEMYQKKLWDVLVTYRVSTRDWIKSLNAIAPANMRFNFWSGRSTTESFSQQMNAMEDSATEALKKLNKRQACYSGAKTACADLALPNVTSSIPPIPLDIPSHVLNHKHLLERGMVNVSPNRTETRPMVATLGESYCFFGDQPSYYLLWRIHSPTIKMRAAQISSLGDLYFIDVQKRIPNDGYLQSLRDLGVRYLFQPSGNPYLCADSGNDLSRILRMDALHKSILRHELFTGTGMDPEAIELSISGNPNLTESQIASYMQSSISILHEKGELGLSRIIGEEGVFELERRAGIWQQGSAYLDEMIANAADMNMRAVEILSHAPIYASSLYMSRGYPSLLFLTFNKTLQTSDLSFFAHHERLPLSAFRLLSYRQDLKSMYNEEEVVQLMQGGRH